MSTMGLESLIGDLRRLAILEEDQLKALEELSAQGATTGELGRELEQRGWMTPYQVQQVVRGTVERLVLGQYVILDQLGSGGMGHVYKARHRLMHRIVAVKTIRREAITNQASLQRFYREIRAAAQLIHPNVVLAFDADQVGDTHYMVMEYVPGVDLAQFVKEHGALPVTWACEFIRQAAMGLHYAHERGLVHRDVKPSNLLLTWTEGVSHPGMFGGAEPVSMGPQAVVKVLDLGLARLRESEKQHTELTHEGQFMGTPDFVAPEQALAAHDADHRADLYSLGCTLYYFLTGQVPFPGTKVTEKLLKHQLETPISILELRPETPLAVAEIVERLMAKQPDERFPDCAELVMALMPFCQTVGYSDFLETMPKPGDPAAVGDTNTHSLTPPSVENDAMVVLNPSRSVAAEMLEAFPLSSVSKEQPRVEPPRLEPLRIKRPVSRPVVSVRPWYHNRRRVAALVGLLVAVMSSATATVVYTVVKGSDLPSTEAVGAVVTTGDTRPTAAPVPPTPIAPPTRITTKTETPKVIEPVRKPGKYAFVLGISNCDGKDLKDLPKADDDMIAFAASLGSSQFENASVVLMTGKNTGRWRPTRDAILRELRQLLQERIEEDSVLIALTCHVIQFNDKDGECYLCPCDAHVSAADRSSLIPLKDVYEEVSHCKAAFKLVLLDVCRRNPGVRSDLNLKQISEPQQMALPARTAVYFSTSPGDAWDGEKRGYEKDHNRGFFGAINQARRKSQEITEFEVDLERYTQAHVFADVRQIPLRLGRTYGIEPLTCWRKMCEEPAGWPTSKQVVSFKHTQRVTSVAFSPNGLWAVSGGEDDEGPVRVWKLEQFESAVKPIKLNFVDVTQCRARTVSFGPDSDLIVVGTGYGGNYSLNTVRLYRLSEGGQIGKAATTGNYQQHGVTCVALAPDTNSIVASCRDGKLRTGQFKNRELTLSPATGIDNRPLVGVQFTATPNEVVYAVSDGTIRLWNIASGVRRKIWSEPKPIHATAVSPDRKYLLVGGDDGSLRLWDLNNPEMKPVSFTGTPASAIQCIAFTPDGSRAITGSDDGMVRLWDMKSRSLIPDFVCSHDKDTAVNGVAISPDGRFALSGGDDKTVHLWALPPASARR
jgi:serine/threonine protein kinase/WD40 repeat protein